MQTTDMLKQEHEIITNCIRRFSQFLQTVEEGNIEQCQVFIEFVRNFVDKYHHAKEEEFYFKWMKKKEPNLEFGPLQCMLSEHDQGRDLIVQAEQTIKNKNVSETIGILSQFIDLLTNHIEKENTVLYQMAEQLNSIHQDGDNEMLAEFEKVNLELCKISEDFSNVEFN